MANQLLDQFDLKKDTEEITIPAKRNTGNSLVVMVTILPQLKLQKKKQDI